MSKAYTDIREALYSQSFADAVSNGEPIYVMGRRYVCDDDPVKFTEAEARAMRDALRRLARKECRASDV